MRPEIAAHYSPQVVGQALDRFGIRNVRVLSDWHARTLQGMRNGETCVLRVSHSAHRTFDEISGEVAWIRDLEAVGIPAPQPLPSLAGRLCEKIEGDGWHMTAVAFSALHGRELTDSDWNQRTFRAWGGLIGRLHRHARQAPAYVRKPWYESDFLNFARYLSSEEHFVRENAEALVERLRRLPAVPGSYGLIHADVYQDNLRILDSGDLELFDFDNAEYGWFVSDVANSVYAALWRVPNPTDWVPFAEGFLEAFLSGYAEWSSVPDLQLELLSDFLRLRDVLIYTVARKQLDAGRLTGRQSHLLAIRRARIEAALPVVDIQISKLGFA